MSLDRAEQDLIKTLSAAIAADIDQEILREMLKKPDISLMSNPADSTATLSIPYEEMSIDEKIDFLMKKMYGENY